MIGIDTNVLLRFYENESSVQSECAQQAIRNNAPVFINEIVLVEFVWVCRSRYKLDRAAIHRRLEAIVYADEFRFARPGAVERAVQGYGSSKSDFADALIAEMNRDCGCKTTLTFDMDAAKSEAFTLVSG
jgi:predicted nucleic-acid-binding protein